jgi:two-component system, NtrC family, sensor kinase
MSFLNKYIPAFWTARPVSAGSNEPLLNYRRIWKLSVLLTGVVALVPLIFITLLDYQVTEEALLSEFKLRTARNVSNMRRTIEFFLTERRSALDFIVHDNPPAALYDPQRLMTILDGMQNSFGGGFMDLSVIDSTGRQRTYVGPYNLQNKNYADQPWFRQVAERGVYISDVFLGFRNVPHLVIAIRQDLPDSAFHILRASIGIASFQELLADMELAGSGDAFIINHEGILQTNSRAHGSVLDKLNLDIPQYQDTTIVHEGTDPHGEELVIGYRFIEGTPFILMVVKQKAILMQPWRSTRLGLIIFLAVSVTGILAVILGTATFMVRKIHIADEKRLMSLHQAEYASKLATIGRMAASVAHEINNPLAIINEKAGLIKDLFTIKKRYAADGKLNGLVDSILESVKRAGRITKRLLTFARHLEVSLETIRLEEIIREVLSFLEKEAELRNIQIHLTVQPETPAIDSDRGKLQQIFLNLINNAFAAMGDNGRLEIRVGIESGERVMVQICDNGCGIAPEHLPHIFEPFFSTRTGQGGTGLGLSITYNLTQEIDGDITVTSEAGLGTCFTIFLPLAAVPREEKINACIVGR